MTKKILVFLNLFTLHFGLANYLQKNLDCELYALIDTTDKPKKFFQEQKIVQFHKTWFYHDNIGIKKNYDQDYLNYLDKRYDLDLRQLEKNDRFFSNFNNFHKFSHEEILSILTQEGKLFEKIIDDCKPDFLVMFQPSLRHEFVFYELCKKNNIIPMIINPSFIGYSTFISRDINLLDNLDYQNEKIKNKSFRELQNYYNEHNTNKQIIDYVNNFANSKSSLIKAGIQFLINSDNSNEKTHYTYTGRTKTKVLFETLKNKSRKKIRQKFIENNLETKIISKSFIYFPLQVEPDRNLLLGAPNYTNQIHSIQQISKSLPSDFKLYVKEHPGQNREWRKTSYYKEILKIPNVELLSPTVPSSEIYEKCSMVITALGTSGFEAAFYGKPVIVFADTIYSTLPSVQKMNSFDELPKLIKNGLKFKIKPNDLEKLLLFLERNSFDFDLFGYYTMQAHEFFYDSNLIDVKISENKMKSFLERNSDIFSNIGNILVKKIIHSEGNKINE